MLSANYNDESDPKSRLRKLLTKTISTHTFDADGAPCSERIVVDTKFDMRNLESVSKMTV